MSKSKLPPPSSGALRVFDGGKARPRPPTQEYQTGPHAAPKSAERETDIPIFEEPVQSARDPLEMLEVVTFEAGQIVRDEKQPPTLKFYEIVSGFAHERALDLEGRTKADPRDLGVGETIGLTSFTRVVSKTVLRVRVYDLEKIEADGDRGMLILAMRKLLGASLNATTENRNAVVKAQHRLREAEEGNQILVGEKRGLQQKFDELNSLTSQHLHELREQVIRPIHKKIKDRDAEIAVLTDWLETAFKLLPPQFAELARLRKDRVADAESLQLMLEGVEQLIESEVTDDHERRLATLVAIVSQALETMVQSDDPVLAQTGFKAMGELFAFKMRPPRLQKKAPAT